MNSFFPAAYLNLLILFSLATDTEASLVILTDPFMNMSSIYDAACQLCLSDPS